MYIFIFQKLFILEAHFYNGLISFLDNESTASDGVSFIWTNRSRSPCGSFYYSIQSLFVFIWCFVARTCYCTTLLHDEEHLEVLSMLLTRTVLHDERVGCGEEEKQSLWFLVYSPGPHYLAALSWMAGLRAGQVRVLSISLKYLHLAVSTVLQVLPKIHLEYLCGTELLNFVSRVCSKPLGDFQD